MTSENLPDKAAEAGQERLSEQIARTGMFGTETTGDTSGYGGLRVRRAPVPSSPRPYGSYFDEVADRLADGMEREGPGFDEAIERVIVDRGELTLHVRREHLGSVAKVLRDEPSLAFELCLGVSGVHYPWETGRELHAVYALLSITHNRRLRLEVSAPDLRAHLRRPSRADADPDARRLEGPPGAQGLPARRHPGGIPRCPCAAARGAEGLPMTELAARAGGSRGSSPRASTAPPEERRACL